MNEEEGSQRRNATLIGECFEDGQNLLGEGERLTMRPIEGRAVLAPMPEIVFWRNEVVTGVDVNHGSEGECGGADGGTRGREQEFLADVVDHAILIDQREVSVAGDILGEDEIG